MKSKKISKQNTTEKTVAIKKQIHGIKKIVKEIKNTLKEHIEQENGKEITTN